MAKPLAPSVAPRRPVIITKKPSGGGGAAFIIIAMVFAIAGAVWIFTNQSKKQQVTAAPTPAPVVAVEAKPTPIPTPAPIARIEPVKKDEPAPAPTTAPEPMKTAAAPLPNVPVPPTRAEADPYQPLLPLDTTAARSAGAQERAAQLLRTAMEKNEWSKYLDLLQRSLLAELKKSPDFTSVQRYDRYTSNPYFMRAMLQNALGTLAGDDLRKLLASDQRVTQHAVWLFENNDAMESFLRAYTPGDNMRRAIETWSQLSADDQEALGVYRELAVACSLVLEKPKKFDWNGKDVTITAEERYRWYKKKDKAGELVGKIKEMTAWELAWVVGVQVPEEEMEWALSELTRKLKQKDWGRAYGMVPYDMQKAVTGKMKEPYDYYTFSEILKKGGICGDRAYFAANTARSAGIPAVSISGDGPQGPHAWISWLADDGRWAFSGRFDGYPAGTVHDPRNGSKMSEQRFTRLSDNHAPSNATILKAQRLVWMHDLQNRVGQKAEADYAMDFALKTSPHQAELWEKKIAFWSNMLPPPAPGQWKTFLDALKREFRDDSDLLVIARKAEDKYMLANANPEMVKNELRGDVRDLAKLKGLTSLDEIRSAHQRYAELVLKTNDYAALRRVYRDALDDYGVEAAKFKALARDYWKLVATAAPEIRKNAARDIEGAYERHVETKAGDYFSVKSQISAAAVVAQCWREAGDEARAARFEKESEKRDKKATKNAL